MDTGIWSLQDWLDKDEFGTISLEMMSVAAKQKSLPEFERAFEAWMDKVSPKLRYVLKNSVNFPDNLLPVIRKAVEMGSMVVYERLVSDFPNDGKIRNELVETSIQGRNMLFLDAMAQTGVCSDKEIVRSLRSFYTMVPKGEESLAFIDALTKSVYSRSPSSLSDLLYVPAAYGIDDDFEYEEHILSSIVRNIPAEDVLRSGVVLMDPDLIKEKITSRDGFSWSAMLIDDAAGKSQGMLSLWMAPFELATVFGRDSLGVSMLSRGSPEMLDRSRYFVADDCQGTKSTLESLLLKRRRLPKEPSARSSV